jgi:hypothetical protein
MHLPTNVKSNNISKWHMEFNSAFKGLFSILMIGVLNLLAVIVFKVLLFRKDTNLSRLQVRYYPAFEGQSVPNMQLCHRLSDMESVYQSLLVPQILSLTPV